MKNLKYILLSMTIIFISFSCKDDDSGEAALVLETGAVPNFLKDAATDQIFDLTKVLNGEPLNLTFNASVAQGDPASTDIIASYSKLSGDVYNAVFFSNVTLPQDFSLTLSDVFAAFAELNSAADLELGDILTVSARFTMSDGRVLSLLNEDGSNNFGTNIGNSKLFTATINYPVSCPTMLEGNYTSTVIASNLNIGANFRSPQPVTITQPSAGTYILSDGTADIFGPDFPIGLQFTDVCGTITVASPSVQYPGVVDYIDNGATLDPNTGIITMALEYTSGSCCGLPGITWTLELVPN